MNSSLTISLIGRPNVGKSSIYNALMKKSNKVMTYDLPGVTRDRHYGILNLEKDKEVILVDTGGFYPQEIDEDSNTTNLSVKVNNHFFNIMRDYAKVAIDESDLVLFVVDVREGLLPFDKSIADYIRQAKKPFWVLVNKYDSDAQAGHELDFYSLGIEQKDIFLLSAAHGRGIYELESKIGSFFDEFNGVKNISMQKGVRPREDVIASIALIGSPNAGKSTLLNKLIGSDRALVSEIPGTTVDPIEGYFTLEFGDILKSSETVATEEQENNGDEVTAFCGRRSVKLIDTAGIRRQKSINGFVESQSVFRALKSISEADIVVYLIDAFKGMGHQDQRLMDISLEKGKSLIICMNKMDLIEDNLQTKNDRKKWEDDLRYKIPWLSYCDLITISAKYSKSIKSLRNAIRKTILVRMKKISTGELNRFVKTVVDKHPIALKGTHGVRFKIKYASMLKSSPPTFLFFTNKKIGIPDSYKKYIKNSLRDEFKLKNSPIHLIFRTGDEDKIKANVNKDKKI